MNLTKTFYRFARSVNRNLPSLLSAGAIVGLGISTYFTAKASPKIISLISELDLENEEKRDLNKEIIKETAIESIPAGVSILVTGALILGSNSINTRRIRYMGAAYNNLSNRFKEYRLAALSGLGIDGYNKLQEKYAEKYIEEKEPYIEPGKHVFFDEFSKQTFIASLDQVLEAEYHLNRNFILRGYASINEFYDFLSCFGVSEIKKIDGGDLLCWSIDAGIEFYGYEWIDFINREITDKDGGTWYSISMPFEPTMDDYLHYLNYGTSIVTDGNGEVVDSQKLHGIT